MRPWCFVLMLFGKKPDSGGRTIDFDRVYIDVIAKAVTAAGMEPLRADGEAIGGIIRKPIFERLILCDYAVADLTIANANVFNELGVRRGIRPASAVLIFASDTRLPFDVALLRGVPYKLNADGAPISAERSTDAIRSLLEECTRTPLADSPVHQLVADPTPPPIDRLKTEAFRSQIDYPLAPQSSNLMDRSPTHRSK